MEISRLTIKNFRGVKRAELDFKGPCAGHEFEEFYQDAGTALRICSGPGGLRGNRVFDSCAHFRLRSKGHARDHLAGHGLETVAKAH